MGFEVDELFHNKIVVIHAGINDGMVSLILLLILSTSTGFSQPQTGVDQIFQLKHP